MLAPKELPAGGKHARPNFEKRAAVLVDMRRPPGRGLCHLWQNRAALLSPRMRRFIDPLAAASN
jgi:DNA-binding transcriptional LysR family regulator